MGVKNSIVLWPLRVAVSGKASTPGGATELCALLGKAESLFPHPRRASPAWAAKSQTAKNLPPLVGAEGFFDENSRYLPNETCAI